MVLTSARLRGIHPPDNIQNGGHPAGSTLLISALARTVSIFMTNHGVAAVTRVDLLYVLIL